MRDKPRMRQKGGRVKVDFGQFWLNGASDADTVNLQILVPPGGFEFQPDPSKLFGLMSMIL